MRTYKDAFAWAVVPAMLDAATAAIEAKRRLRQLATEAHWRLNEAEAQVHARFFADRWQSLIPNYGERRCIGADDATYWPRYNSNAKPDLHTGDPLRRGKLYAVVLLLLILLTTCTTARPDSDPAAVLAAPVTASVEQQAHAQQAAAQLYAWLPDKVKGNGNVFIYQVGTGNTANPTTTDNTKAGSRGGASSSGPESPVSNDSKRGGGGVSPWWFVATAIGAVALWQLLKPKFAAWWARPG